MPYTAIEILCDWAYEILRAYEDFLFEKRFADLSVDFNPVWEEVGTGTEKK